MFTASSHCSGLSAPRPPPRMGVEEGRSHVAMCLSTGQSALKPQGLQLLVCSLALLPPLSLSVFILPKMLRSVLVSSPTPNLCHHPEYICWGCLPLPTVIGSQASVWTPASSPGCESKRTGGIAVPLRMLLPILVFPACTRWTRRGRQKEENHPQAASTLHFLAPCVTPMPRI